MRNIFFIVFIFTVFSSYSQNKALFMEHTLPQSISLNPAVQIPCNKYFGMPALSSLSFAFNSSFAYNEILRNGKGRFQDSIVFDYVNLYPKAKRSNYLKAKTELVWIDFGFRKKKRYYSFTLKSVVDAGFYYSKDLLALPAGNWSFDQNQSLNFNLNGTRPDLLAYTTISVAISEKIDEHWQYGLRLSYLQGAANIHAKKSNIDVKTEIQPVGITINPNYVLNAAMPLQLSFDSAGRISDWKFAPSNPLHDFLLNNNHGVSLDFGFVYRQQKLTMAGSLLNIGTIFWASQVQNLESKRSVLFTGINLRNYLSGNTGSANIKANLKDSVKQILKFTPQTHPYFSLLPLDLFFGIRYKLLPKLNMASSVELVYDYKQFVVSTSLSSTYKLTSFLALQLNTSYVNRRLDNFGLGIITKFRVVQFHFFSEKIPINYFRLNSLPLFLPYSARTMNFRLGINFVFGCSKKDISMDNTYCPAYK